MVAGYLGVTWTLGLPAGTPRPPPLRGPAGPTRRKGSGFKAGLGSEVALKQVSGSGTEVAFRPFWFRAALRQSRFVPASDESGFFVGVRKPL